MRNLFVTFFLLALPLAATTPPGEVEARRQEIYHRLEEIRENPEGRSEPERLESFIDLYFDYAMLEFPEFATSIGHPEGHDRWTDNSLEADARRDRDRERALEVLRTFDRSQLQGQDRVNYDLLLEDYALEVEGARFPGEVLAINQMSGPQQSIPRVLLRNPARTAADYEDILARLRGIPEVLDNTIARLEKGLETGVTPPKVTLRGLPDQVYGLLHGDPLQSPILEPFRELPEGIAPGEAARIREEAARIYRDEVAPPLRRLHAFLLDTYIPGARETIAMKDLPEGEAWYAFRVKATTTTDLTPEEIHELGLSEVRRIRAEMDEAMAAADFQGSFREFTQLLRTEPRFYFEDPDELIKTYRAIAKRADAELVKLFGHLPRLPYGIEPVPEHIAESQTTAYYERGSLEAGRPGVFFANTYDLKSRPSWEMEALTLHEAVPGHHLQIAIAQELEDLPWFRRFGGYTAFVEGWGLYAESLGEEIGFYQDPYSKFGQLTYEIWRAIRLVVDTGMHHLGWTRQQAIDYFKENTGKADHDIVVEVDRYIVWPAQALAYKIGELKIKELRAEAQEELGEAFDVRAFHDAVLGHGALPLSVLEKQIRDWVAGERAAAAAAGGRRC